MGTAATWVGGTMALYFWLFFDIGVPTGGMQYVNGRYEPAKVVNLGLMQDRNMGMMVSLAILPHGVYAKHMARNDPAPRPKQPHEKWGIRAGSPPEGILITLVQGFAGCLGCLYFGGSGP